MSDITIPEEAAKALAMAVLEIAGEGIDMEEASAACLAMLKAWPGMSDIPAGEFDGEQYPRIIHLPLTENTNAEG